MTIPQMHLCLVTPEFPPDKHGGVGTLMVEMTCGAIAAGHKVSVIHIDRASGERGVRMEYLMGAEVYRLSLSAPKWLRWRLGELWALREIRLMVWSIHRQCPISGLFVTDGSGYFPNGTPANIPLVTALEGTEYLFHQEMNLPRESEFVFNLQRRTMENSSILVANSSYTSRAMPACYGLKNKSIRLIYHSIDTALFSPSDAVTVEEGLIVFANSIEQRKGVFELMEAIKLVCAEFPNARLHLAGKDVKKGASGEPLSVELWKGLPAEMRERVTFLGALDRGAALLDLLRRAHVCVYPSYIETFGYAPAEAMSVGKAVIYSKTGPGPELIQDGISGLLCDPRSPAEIAACIGRVLRSPDLARTLGANARLTALRMFDRESWTPRMLELFAEAAGVRP